MAFPDPGMSARLHHVALIGADYLRSKHFYVDLLGPILGLRVIAETYRQARDSWKLDLALADGTQLELFSFPAAPPRVSRPEACGLRHVAFAVADLDAVRDALQARGIVCEPIRVDPLTDARFTFFADPDDTPLELYESSP